MTMELLASIYACAQYQHLYQTAGLARGKYLYCNSLAFVLFWREQTFIIIMIIMLSSASFITMLCICFYLLRLYSEAVFCMRLIISCKFHLQTQTILVQVCMYVCYSSRDYCSLGLYAYMYVCYCSLDYCSLGLYVCTLLQPRLLQSRFAYETCTKCFFLTVILYQISS